MSLIEGRAHIGPDGELRVTLPPPLRDKDVKYSLEAQPSDTRQTNGTASIEPERATADTQAKWRSHLRRFGGSMSDYPDVDRPGAASYPHAPLGE